MNHLTAPLTTSLPRYGDRQSAHQPRHYLLATQDAGTEPYVSLMEKGLPLVHLSLPRLGSLQGLQQAVAAQLAQSQVGVQLEVHGDEAFLWALRSVANEAGLLTEEIGLHLQGQDQQGQDQRHIFCVHCSRVQPGTASERHVCCACGVVLEVRRHFSERLGAYLGVCADADSPYKEARP